MRDLGRVLTGQWRCCKRRVIAYYLACLVQDQIKKKFDIVLAVVEIMKNRFVLRDLGLFLPFGLVRGREYHTVPNNLEAWGLFHQKWKAQRGLEITMVFAESEDQWHDASLEWCHDDWRGPITEKFWTLCSLEDLLNTEADIRLTRDIHEQWERCRDGRAYIVFLYRNGIAPSQIYSWACCSLDRYGWHWI